MDAIEKSVNQIDRNEEIAVDTRDRLERHIMNFDNYCDIVALLSSDWDPEYAMLNQFEIYHRTSSVLLSPNVSDHEEDLLDKVKKANDALIKAMREDLGVVGRNHLDGEDGSTLGGIK
ncbi:hypothetical protein GCM10027436_81680 [Actinophytocola sediminis]